MNAGPSECWALVWAMTDGKTQTEKTTSTGHAHERAIIRAKDPVQCALGQIARHEVAGALANKMQYIDADSPVGSFYKSHLFFTTNCLNVLSPSTHGVASKMLLLQGAGLDVDGLGGHGSRRFAAQTQDRAGVPPEVRSLPASTAPASPIIYGLRLIASGCPCLTYY